MIILPATLTAAAACAIVNIWLSMRIGRVRQAQKISIGDGGNDLLARRMRAQLNFAENTPLVLILIAAIELAGKGGVWLLPLGGVYAIGRVAHGIGMDGTALERGRMIGTLITMLTLLGLAVVAVLVVAGIV
jgi:uncharacterized membrane protein YecN with MAPEG domain